MTDLEAALVRARAAFDALTPEQQAAFRREQAIDWAYGQLMATTSHREGVTRERIAEIYDARERGTQAPEPPCGCNEYGVCGNCGPAPARR